MKRFAKFAALFLATFIVVAAVLPASVAHAQVDFSGIGGVPATNTNNKATVDPASLIPGATPKTSNTINTASGDTTVKKPTSNDNSIVNNKAQTNLGAGKVNTAVKNDLSTTATEQAALAATGNAAPTASTDAATADGTAAAGTTAAGQNPGGSAAAQEKYTCDLAGFFSHFAYCAGNSIGYLIFSLINYLLSIVGWLFNIVIERTVFGFGAFFSGNAGILAGWSVIRDVCNIALLFGFILLGITTILELQQYEVKKTLPRLIIFAILLNFSLLASQAIIDTSNIFASTLYGQSYNCSSANKSDCGDTSGVSNSIMFESGAGSVFDLKESGSPGFMFYMLASIFAIILMVVLLAGAILLITRAVVLAFLMVLSPIGFAAFAIPPLEKYAKMWWDKLLSQAFFAPLYLLLIFVSLKIGGTLTSGSSGGVGSFGALVTGPDSSTIDQMLVFGIMIGMLVASLMIAKQLGMVGAQLATNIATKAISYPFAVAGRYTAGRGMSMAGKWFDKKMGQGVANKSGWAMALRKTGLDEVVAGGFKGGAEMKFGGFASYAERQKQAAEYKRTTERAANKAKLFDAIADAEAHPDDPTKDEEVKKLLQQMSDTEIEQSEIIQKGDDKQIAAIAVALSPEKFEQVMKNKEYTQAQKDKMAAARFGKVDASNAKNLTTKDLEQLARAYPDKFNQYVTRKSDGTVDLREDQLEALGKSERLTDTQRKAAYAATAVGAVDDAATLEHFDSGKIKSVMREMSTEQKSNLKTSTFIRKNDRGDYEINSDAVDMLDHNDLEALMAKKKLSTEARKKIIEHINQQFMNNPNDERLAGIDHYFKKNGFAAGQWGWHSQPEPSATPAQPQQASGASEQQKRSDFRSRAAEARSRDRRPLS